jgi:hypothetical protein
VRLDFRDSNFVFTVDPDNAAFKFEITLSFEGYETVERGELEKELFLDPPCMIDPRPPLSAGT